MNFLHKLKNHKNRQQSEEADNYEGSERGQDEYEGDDNDKEQDEDESGTEVPGQDVEDEDDDNDPGEEEEEEGEGQEGEEEQGEEEEDRPATQGASKDELLQAGAIFAKQLLAAQTNAKGGHQGTPLSHQDVEHEVSDEHVCVSLNF